MLRREISAGAQERGKDTHQRTRTRPRKSCPGLWARGKPKAPTLRESHAAAATAAWRDGTAAIRMPFDPPLAPPQQSQGGRGRGGRGRGGVIGPQQPQGPMFLQPMGMPGLLQPPGPADPVQRLALMMALMVLGMPPVYSCHTTAGCGSPLEAGMSEPRICPPVGSGGGIGVSATKEELDTRQWRRLPAVHCLAMQSSLSFMCGPDGRTRKVK